MPPRKARHSDLQRNIIDFCRLLREREMLVTPSEVIDAIRTADAVDITDRQEFKTALRSVLTAKPEDIPMLILPSGVQPLAQMNRHLRKRSGWPFLRNVKRTLAPVALAQQSLLRIGANAF